MNVCLCACMDLYCACLFVSARVADKCNERAYYSYDLAPHAVYI